VSRRPSTYGFSWPLPVRVDGTEYIPAAWYRKEKRHNRPSDFGLRQAYDRGESRSMRNMTKRNPYPPGRRHDEWERGYNECDPIGDFHGRNL
jgi:hypothetical protein